MRRRILNEGTPAAAGLSPEGLERAVWTVRDAVAAGQVPGAVLLVARRGTVALRIAIGLSAPEPDGRPLLADDLFLVASLTKPIACLPILLLIERGEVLLDDPATRFIPEMTAPGAEKILIRHLLTHTSGLPDMLPENEALRSRHAPLSEFVAAACRISPQFEPGTDWQYQSMGILLLATVVERVAGQPLPEVLQETVFGPLGLRNTFLGLREGYEKRLVPVNLPEAQRGLDWNWNSPYWRGFGAPWGGLHSTASELAVILQMVLNGGSYGDVTVLSPASAAAATSEQTAFLELPPEVRRQRRWGFGWRLATGMDGPPWPDLLSRRAFGHIGATGTMFWAEPETEMLCVLLANQPIEDLERLFARVGNILAASPR